MKTRAAIKAIASHLPERALTNDQVVQELEGDWEAGKILEKTGVATQ